MTWFSAFPVLAAATVAAAVAPGLLASSAMALAVLFVGRGLVSAAQWQRLVLEVGFGAVCYAGLLLAFHPPR